jgi:hypothetical protein
LCPCFLQHGDMGVERLEVGEPSFGHWRTPYRNVSQPSTDYATTRLTKDVSSRYWRPSGVAVLLDTGNSFCRPSVWGRAAIINSSDHRTAATKFKETVPGWGDDSLSQPGTSPWPDGPGHRLPPAAPGPF